MICENKLNSVERLISIYDTLNKKQLNAAELAEKYKVSKKTIYRDIKKMKYAGVDVYGYRKGYKII